MNDEIIKLILNNYLNDINETNSSMAISLFKFNADLKDSNSETNLHIQLNVKLVSLIQSRLSLERKLGLKLCSIWLNEQVSSLDCVRQFGKQWLEKSLSIINRGNDDSIIMELSMKLINEIFSSSQRLPEFSRSVTQPLSVKYAQKLIDLSNNRSDLLIQSFNSINHHLINHPSSFRPHLTSLNSLIINSIANSPNHSSKSYLTSLSNLYFNSCKASGKVNASQSFKSLIESSLISIEYDLNVIFNECYPISYNVNDKGLNLHSITSISNDILVDSPFIIKRIETLFYIISKSLSNYNDTFISIPIGKIVKMCTKVLHLTPTIIKENSNKLEISSRISSLVPITSYVCGLLAQLSSSVHQSFSPHLSQIINAVSFHLTSDSNLNDSIKSSLYNLMNHLVNSRTLFDIDNIHLLRVFKSALRSLSPLFPPKHSPISNVSFNNKSTGKGKKRSRNQFESDEAFSITYKLSLSGTKVIINALKFIENAINIVPSIESITMKIILALSLDQEWKSFLVDYQAIEAIMKSIRNLLTNKKMLCSPQSSWAIEMIGSNAVVDAIIHPVILPPISINSELDEKHENLRKEVNKVKLALGVIDDTNEEDEDEDDEEDEDEDEENGDKENNEMKDIESNNDNQNDNEKSKDDNITQTDLNQQENLSKSSSTAIPMKVELNNYSTNSANGQFDFAVEKGDDKFETGIKTARPPPIESSKSFIKPIENRNENEDESEDEEMPSIDID